MSTVLVTGGSGFIAGHLIVQLVSSGHIVRTTVRDLRREPEVRATLKQAGIESGPQLKFFAADLTQDAGWKEAVTGCDYVLHVASPFPSKVPKQENDLIIPAREGTLRVLRAARDAGVQRFVQTSSFAAIGYGHEVHGRPFDETDWTDLNSEGLTAYTKSKTIAERSAWDFIQQEGGALEFAVVNPVAVCGPVLGPDFATSILLVQRMLDGSMPGFPCMNFGVVDVRDVADLHLRAMTHPAAKGERFLAVAGDFVSLGDIARILKQRLGPAAKRAPSRELPNWLVRIIALFNPELRQIVPELGKSKNATSAKAQSLLGWAPRSASDAIVATAQSLLAMEIVKS